MAVYPSAIATTTDLPNAGANLSTNPHSSLHDEVRDEVIAVESELGIAPKGSYASVKARLDAGWQPIASASVSAVATFDITIPASTYTMVRISIWGAVATGTAVSLNARVNNDSTANLHAWALGIMFSDTVTTAVDVTDTQWPIGNVNALTNGMFVELLLGETQASSNVPFLSKFGLLDTTEANMRQGFISGQLTANRAISSLRIFPASSTFTGRYVAEGYRV